MDKLLKFLEEEMEIVPEKEAQFILLEDAIVKLYIDEEDSVTVETVMFNRIYPVGHQLREFVDLDEIREEGFVEQYS